MFNARPNFAETIIDEISLEGLEGITLNSLWVYIGASLKLPTPLHNGLQLQIWNFILHKGENFKFFELPVERKPVVLVNRFDRLDPDMGLPLPMNASCVQRYKFNPIQVGKDIGSCEHYEKRKEIPISTLQSLSLNDVQKKWGDKFVIVASPEYRLNALMPKNVCDSKELLLMHYCVLEALGRARYNGETTSGPCSLLNFCEKAPIVFYIKNKLQKMNIITTQFFDEKNDDKSSTAISKTTLVTLVRFHRTYKSHLQTVIEKLFKHLKVAPQYRVTAAEMRQLYATMERPQIFRKMTTTTTFRRVFETRAIPWSELTAEEIQKLGRKNFKKQANCTDRTEPFFCLRNPKLSIEELFAEENVDNDEKLDDDFHSETHSFVDMSLKDEIYRALLRHGTTGCSLTDLYSYTCSSFICIRQMLKTMESEGLVSSYSIDIGRQRVKRLVALEFAASVNEKKKAPLEMKKQLHCSEEPNIPKKLFKLTMSDVPQISAELKPYTIENVASTCGTQTQRQVFRKYMMVKMVDERCIVLVSDLRKAIQHTEKENGYTDEICSKSVMRLLLELTNKSVFRMYLVTLRYEEYIRTYRYVTHPKIEIDHEVLQLEILRLKNSFHLTIEERRLRVDSKAPTNQCQTEKTNVLSKLQMAATTKGSKPPKFLISRHMHEFVYYLAFELQRTRKGAELTESLLRTWQRTEPALNVNDYYAQLQNETPKMFAYNDELSWRTFVPPLPTYEGKPNGWVYYPDIVDRIPLSLFNKIFRIQYVENERLNAYLMHPVRQHYIVLQLPVEMQCYVNRVQLQRIHTMVLKLLNNMGLVQIHKQPTKDPLLVWVYMNRYASVLDTTSSESSLSRINPARHYPRLKFEFNRREVLSSYWTTLQRICICTKLGFRHGAYQPKTTPLKKRVGELQYYSTVQFDEAEENDLGHLPGDQLGAGGLSSKLFAHILRNWSWVLHSNVKKKGTRTVYANNNSQMKQHKIMQRKTRHTMQHLRTLPMSGGSGGAATTTKKSSKKSSCPLDAVDREALKNMRTLRVTWSKHEDELLKMAQAVYQYIAAPVNILLLRTVGRICRDVMRQMLGSCNKITISCVRRMRFLDKTRRNRPEVPNWLHLLRTNTAIQHQYGHNFLQRLKRVYTSQTAFCEALEKHFILLLNHLYREVHDMKPNLGMAGESRIHYILPDTMAEFEQKYRTCSIADENETHHEDPSNEFELKVHTVMSVLHSSLCSARDKTLYNLQAFEIYKHYTEEVLQAAFQRAGKHSFVVAVKRKNIQSVPTQLSGPAYTLSQRYRMSLNILKIPYELYDALYAYLEVAFQTYFNTKEPNNVLYLKSPHIGHLFFIAEGFNLNYWSVQIKLPHNILTIDAEMPQNVSSSDRILDHYQSAFDNAPSTEYSKSQDIDNNEKKARVDFHRANRSYKMYYNPYDRIAKMPAYQLHFFCALASLQKQADLKCSRLYVMNAEHGFATVRCPFKCVLEDANYMQSIERIVVSNRDILDKLSEMPPQQLLNLTNSSDLVTVQPTNLLTLVRMLEAFWREKETPHETKDLGKICAKLKACSGKSIDWLDLCQQILTASKSDDTQMSDDEQNNKGEPILNKEERSVRPQDIYVVSLPELKFRCTKKLTAEKKCILHNGFNVPEVLLESENIRESILTKCLNESHWKYTENTLDSIKSQLTDFNAMELQHLQDIHDYIQSAELGVKMTDLKDAFPIDNFLLRALETLRSHYLIKRVGAVNVIFVHKKHLRGWLVHTFHITRLQRENLGTQTKRKAVSRKRKKQSNAKEDSSSTKEEKPTASKRARLSERTATTNDNTTNVEKPTTSKRARMSNTTIKDDHQQIGNVSAHTKRTVKALAKRTNDERGKVTDNIMKRDTIAMHPQPWIRLNGSLNRRVLDKLMGTILIECIASCGCNVQNICNRFPYHLPSDIMYLLELLSDLKCVKLLQIQREPVNLFSVYEPNKETPVKLLYDPLNTYIRVLPDAGIRMANFIGNKKYNADFI